MNPSTPACYQDVEKCVDDIIRDVGKEIVFGMPLGLGKPNHLANALYLRAKNDPSISLTICTALSLERPSWKSDLERRFLEPFVERVFGGYVDLEYMVDLRKQALPANVNVKEFYSKAGAYLDLRHAQQNYISSNYTHVYRDLLDNGVNVVGQIVCKDEIDGRTWFSLSSNPDVTLDVTKVLRRQQIQGRKIAAIAQINQNLPFMYGDAMVEPGIFTAVIDNPDYNFRLFGAPKMAVTNTDFMIGLHASALIKDGGTLQIGIGSLGDALCYGLQLREQKNDVYNSVLKESGIYDKFKNTIDAVGGTGRFQEGLLGSTEMLVDGYLHLMKAGVVKRKTYDNVHIQRLINDKKIKEEVTPETLDALLESGAVNSRLTREDFDFLQEYGVFNERCSYGDASGDLTDRDHLNQVRERCLGAALKKGILIHGGFFLGPESFYQELKNMSVEERKLINMTSVLNVNQLYENEYGDEEIKLLQRKHGRFVNACLMVTLSGAVVSDGLENGQMVSGVGGQYNFVSQAHALPDGRSILMCKSTRAKGKDVHSNIVLKYGHVTIPRHLRDLIITEYGIADLRGKNDQQIISALLNITDSRFQRDLLEQAKAAKKIPDDYQIPGQFTNNLPERLAGDLAPFRKEGYFPPFPFGTDFTKEELIIGKALKGLKARMSQGMKKISGISKALVRRKVPEKAIPYLKRLQLDQPKGSKEKMMQKLVINALIADGSV